VEDASGAFFLPWHAHAEVGEGREGKRGGEGKRRKEMREEEVEGGTKERESEGRRRS
jgi:hypothetical protein